MRHNIIPYVAFGGGKVFLSSIVKGNLIILNIYILLEGTLSHNVGLRDGRAGPGIKQEVGE